MTLCDAMTLFNGTRLCSDCEFCDSKMVFGKMKPLDYLVFTLQLEKNPTR